MTTKTKVTTLLLSVFFILNFSIVEAQRIITGTVTDAATRAPLAGVVIASIGGGTTVTTDQEGKYSLFVPGVSNRLRFTLAGYKKVTKRIKGPDDIHVVMIQQVEADAIFRDSLECCTHLEHITAATAKVEEEDFNQGYITNPLLLIQGKIPGVQIYTQGGDPNAASLLRIRGLSGLTESEGPLIVVDGIVGAALESVDPNDIESIRLLKDGSAAAFYGIRANGGVLEITTKRGTAGEDVKWTYNGQFAVETAVDPIATLTADEFRAAGGVDLGSQTDWFDEITTTPLSYSQGLAATGGIGKRSTFRISANLRERKGVLRNTGFEQFNTRLNFSSKAFRDKLSIDFVTSYTHRAQENAYVEALKYATQFNPTAPIFGADAPFSFNEEQYGGYFETIGLFDNYNPVAIVEQNRNETQKRIFNYRAQLSYEIMQGLSLKFSLAQQQFDLANTQYAPPTALFLGNASSPTRKGLASFYESDATLQTYEGAFNYQVVYEKVGLDLTAGYFFQEDNFSDQFYSLGDFPNNDLDFFKLIETSQDLNNAGFIDAFSNASPDNRVIAFYGRGSLNFKNRLFVNFALRREGSSKLGVDNKWGWFPAIGLAADLMPYLNVEGMDMLMVRFGYGITGGLPREHGLSQPLRRIINDERTGAVFSDLLNMTNLNLKWEEKSVSNLGVDLSAGKLSATLDWYQSKTKDIIDLRSVDLLPLGNFLRYDNFIEIHSSGFELSLSYNLIQQDALSYRSGIILSTNNNTLEAYESERTLRGNPNAPGFCCTGMILTEVGAAIGNMWGPVFQGVDEFGSPLFEDVNEDGNLVTDWGLDPAVDFAILGNGLPEWELGWSNQVKLGDWSLNAFFRGVFGHSLVNVNRLVYEPASYYNTKPYNFVNTELAVDDLTVSRYSSLYVEKASFLKLDNLTIARMIHFEQAGFESLQVSLTFQNLFVLTNYTGSNPEPRLVDVEGTPFSEQGISIDPLAPGIDRSASYIPTRSVVLGLRMRF